jgi:hypothetical protein
LDAGIRPAEYSAGNCNRLRDRGARPPRTIVVSQPLKRAHPTFRRFLNRFADNFGEKFKEERAYLLAMMRRQMNSVVHLRMNVLLLLDDG